MAFIDIIWITLTCIGSYLIGSIPFSVVIGKIFFSDDVRKHHSGNPGGFNAARTYGFAIGLTVVLLDILKGFLVILLVDVIYSSSHFSLQPSGAIIHTIMVIVCPALAVLGHNFPIWLNFNGGQGLGVFMGTLFYVNPLIFIFYGLSFIIFVAIIKMSTRKAGVIIVLLCVPVALFLSFGPPWGFILNDWTLGPNNLLQLTQAILIFIMDLALLSTLVKNLKTKSNVGLKKMTTVE